MMELMCSEDQTELTLLLRLTDGVETSGDRHTRRAVENGARAEPTLSMQRDAGHPTGSAIAIARSPRLQEGTDPVMPGALATGPRPGTLGPTSDDGNVGTLTRERGPCTDLGAKTRAGFPCWSQAEEFRAYTRVTRGTRDTERLLESEASLHPQHGIA